MHFVSDARHVIGTGLAGTGRAPELPYSEQTGDVLQWGGLSDEAVSVVGGGPALGRIGEV
jgi:hypothetical protein